MKKEPRSDERFVTRCAIADNILRYSFRLDRPDLSKRPKKEDALIDWAVKEAYAMFEPLVGDRIAKPFGVGCLPPLYGKEAVQNFLGENAIAQLYCQLREIIGEENPVSAYEAVKYTYFGSKEKSSEKGIVTGMDYLIQNNVYTFQTGSMALNKKSELDTFVDNEAMDKVMEDTGIKGKVKNAIRKNEIQGLASAVAIGAGIGFTIGFAVSLAQSGITPDSVKYAFVNGGKSGVASGVQSVVGYGIGRTIGQVATNAIEGVLSNAGLEITANISKMCTMGTVGAITVAVFSTVQFVKLIYRGECLKSAAIQVGKQALFSLSLLAISIAAQGMWGGPAGIIVSIGTGIVIVSYTIADAVHQRTFAEECHIKTIEEYGRLALRHLNELQFA